MKGLINCLVGLGIVAPFIVIIGGAVLLWGWLNTVLGSLILLCALCGAFAIFLGLYALGAFAREVWEDRKS